MTMMLLLMLAAAPQPGAIRTFKDWSVGCDNVRSCHATSFIPEDSDRDGALTMNVKRDGAGAAAPVVAIIATGAKAAGLAADGNRLPVRLRWQYDEYRIDPRDTMALVEALRSAHEISLLDGKGSVIGTISLAGSSAALLYMDEQQRRTGTATALSRPGPKPASAVPAPPALPVVRSAAATSGKALRVDEERIESLRKTSGCVPEEKDWPGYGSEQEMLDATHGLLLLGCGAGAYNYSSVPFIVSRRGGRLAVEMAKFDRIPRWGEEGSNPMLVNAAWDPKTALLTSFSKSRGIGDCGIGSDYAWDGERFRLVQQIEMPECRESLDYITTWRAKVVPR